MASGGDSKGKDGSNNNPISKRDPSPEYKADKSDLAWFMEFCQPVKVHVRCPHHLSDGNEKLKNLLKKDSDKSREKSVTIKIAENSNRESERTEGESSRKHLIRPEGETNRDQSVRPKVYSNRKQSNRSEGETSREQSVRPKVYSNRKQSNRPEGETSRDQSVRPKVYSNIKQSNRSEGETSRDQSVRPKVYSNIKQSSRSEGEPSRKRSNRPDGEASRKQLFLPEGEQSRKQLDCAIGDSSRKSSDRHEGEPSRKKSDRHEGEPSKKKSDRHEGEPSKKKSDRHEGEPSKKKSDRHEEEPSKKKSDRAKMDPNRKSNRHIDEHSRKRSNRHRRKRSYSPGFGWFENEEPISLAVEELINSGNQRNIAQQTDTIGSHFKNLTYGENFRFCYFKIAHEMGNSWMIFVFQFLVGILAASAIAMGIILFRSCTAVYPAYVPASSILMGISGIILLYKWMDKVCRERRGTPYENREKNKLAIFFITLLFFVALELILFFCESPLNLVLENDIKCNKIFSTYMYCLCIVNPVLLVLAAFLYLPDCVVYFSKFIVSKPSGANEDYQPL